MSCRPTTPEAPPVGDLGELVAYNVPGVSAHLKLTGKVLAAIYQGKITKWNASADRERSTRASRCPASPIVTLHRSDSSGDTFLFTSYLSKADPSGWGTKIAYNTTVPWPDAPGALGETGNSGMVTGCKATPGCIAYIGISYLTQALQAGLGYAELRQRQGAVRGADAGDHRRRGGRLRQEDAGQRDDLADLRSRQATATRSSTTSTPSSRPTSRASSTAKDIRSVLEWAINPKLRRQHDVPGPGQLPAAALQGRGAVGEADPEHQ